MADKVHLQMVNKMAYSRTCHFAGVLAKHVIVTGTVAHAEAVRLRVFSEHFRHRWTPVLARAQQTLSDLGSGLCLTKGSFQNLEHHNNVFEYPFIAQWICQLTLNPPDLKISMKIMVRGMRVQGHRASAQPMLRAYGGNS